MANSTDFPHAHQGETVDRRHVLRWFAIGSVAAPALALAGCAAEGYSPRRDYSGGGGPHQDGRGGGHGGGGGGGHGH